MNYYLLMQDDRIPELPSILSCPDTIDPMEWVRGTVMEDPGLLHFSLPPNSSEQRGDIISGIVTLFHDDLIAELIRLGIDTFQHFPVILEAPDKMREKGYSLINVIDMVDAVDPDASDIEYNDALVRGELNSFTIAPVKAKGHRVFRIPEIPTEIIIDETVKQGLEKYGPAGVMLVLTQDFDMLM